MATMKQVLQEMADDADSAEEMADELADWITSADEGDAAELAAYLASPISRLTARTTKSPGKSKRNDPQPKVVVMPKR